MDVLVKWDKDGSKNVVSSKDLTPLQGGIVRRGTRVKMTWYGKELWEGEVLVTEEDTYNLMHVDVPLTKLNGSTMPPIESQTLLSEDPIESQTLLSEDMPRDAWIPGGRSKVHLRIPKGSVAPDEGIEIPSSPSAAGSTPFTSDYDISSDEDSFAASPCDVGFEDDDKEEQGPKQTGLSCSPLRRGTKTTFKEILQLEAENEDVYIYCEVCSTLYKDECPTHPLTIIEDTPVPAKCKERAKLSLPQGLELNGSGITGAGEGVWAQKEFPKGVRYGPYGGNIVTKELKGRGSGYAWEIFRDKQNVCYINGRNKEISNWMRYVNCARNEDEQNLIAFQYDGQIYYRTIKDIEPGKELLVYYGEEYAKELGIEEAKHVDDGVLHSCPLLLCDRVFTSKLFLLKHMKYRHHQHVDLTAYYKKSSQRKPLCKVLPSTHRPHGFSNSSYDVTQTKSTFGINKLSVSVYLTKLDYLSCEKFVNSRCDSDKVRRKNLSSGRKKESGVKRKKQGIQNGKKMSVQNGKKQSPKNEKRRVQNGKQSVQNRKRSSAQNRRIRIQIPRAEDGDIPQHILNNRIRSSEKIHEIKGEYPCLCGKVFSYQMDLVKHERTHTGEKPFRCDTCGKKFSQKGNLRRHELSHGGVKQFKCDVCGDAFIQYQHLKNHKQEHDSTMRFKCKACGKRFARALGLKLHKTIYCGKSYIYYNTKRKRLMEEGGSEDAWHFEKEQDFDKDVIETRKCQFDQEGKLTVVIGRTKSIELKRKKLSIVPTKSIELKRKKLGIVPKRKKLGFYKHGNLPPYSKLKYNRVRLTKQAKKMKGLHQCDVCNKEFKYHMDLTKHRRTHTGSKPFHCKTCGKGFAQKGNLHRHSLFHKSIKDFICDQCGHEFTQRVHLVIHQRQHTGEKPYQCNECGKQFAQVGNYKSHVRRVHTKEKFGCPFCEKKCADYSNMICHQRLHTGERPYKCPYCPRTFLQSSGKTAHIRMHTDEKPYICPVCCKPFRSNSGLKRHCNSKVCFSHLLY